MITRLYKLDKHVSKPGERCDNYQTTFITSVYYDGRYYYVFETDVNSRGPAHAHVAKKESDFSAEHDFLGEGSLFVESLQRADYNVMSIDDVKMEAFLKSLLPVIDKRAEDGMKKIKEVLEYLDDTFPVYIRPELVDEIKRLSPEVVWTGKEIED